MNQIVCALIIFLLAFSGGCKSHSLSNSPIEGGKVIEKDEFSFIIPSSMIEKKIQGRDTALWLFEDSELSITVEFGAYANLPNYVKNNPNYEEDRVMVNGSFAKLISYLDTEEDVEPNKNIKSQLNLHFSNVNFSSENLLFRSQYKNEEEKKIILSIYNSIKIK